MTWFARIIFAWVASASVAFGAASKPLVAVDTVADLIARNPVPNERVLLSGWDEVGDFGPQRIVRHEPNSVAATNLGCVFDNAGTGRYVAEDCEYGELKAEWFRASPYQSALMTPWAYQTNIAAIGTNDFSVWARLTLPSAFTQPSGWFSINAIRSNTNALANTLGSTFSFRALPGSFGFLARGTNGTSTPGAGTSDAALLSTNTPSVFSAYLGREIDFVFTRSGTNVKAYIDGVDVTGLMINENADGWAKAVGDGYPLALQIGAQENGWYHPKPITRFALWTSALTAGQAANPSAVGSKVVDYTPTDSTEPSDSGPAIQAAIDYAESKNGGTVILKEGKYRLSTGLRIGYRVSLKGAGSAFYPLPQAGGAVFAAGGTYIIPWFGDEIDAISIRREDMNPNSVVLSLRYISAMNSYSYSLNAYSTLSDFCIYGEFARSARGVWVDRVGSVALDRIGFFNIPGHNVYGLMNNGFAIRDCSGSGGRGVAIRGSADTKLTGNFIDNGFGPALWMAGNLGVISGNVFEVARDPTYGASPWKDEVVADAGTDTLTVSLAQGHRFRQGDVVRFITTGVLPSPLTSTNDYYVVSLSTNAFRVYSAYADDIALTGAMYSAGQVDLADAGLGTHYVVPGPAVGMLISGDNNQIVGNISHLNHESGLQLEAARWNSVAGNSFIMNGLGNLDWTNVAGVSLLYGSGQNRFSANGFDNRGNVSYTTNGIITDDTSIQNAFVGNSFTLSNPYKIAANNYVADGQYQVTRNAGSLYIPRTAGFGRYTASQGASMVSTGMVENASAIQYDGTGRRLFLSTQSTTNTDWHYTPMHNFDSSTLWSGGGAGNTLSARNFGPTGYPFLTLYGQYNNSAIYNEISSTNAAEGVRWVLARNAGVSNSVPVAVRAGDQLGEILFFGITSGAGELSAGASISATANTEFSTTNSEGYIAFNVTPNGSTTRESQLLVRNQGRLQFAGQNSNPTVSVGNGQLFFHNTNGFTQRRAGAWEHLVGTTNHPTADGAYILFVTNGVASWIAHP